MTRQSSFKSRVRARMDKTGESYTTARRRLIERSDAASPTDATPSTDAVNAQRLSVSAVLERTGREPDAWFALLDAWGATDRTHTEIARRLVDEHGVDGWWAQTITVGYEQARGMRAPGQQSDGSFSASASKTVDVAAERAFEAFADAELRARWLPGVEVRVRTATPPKWFRADWEDGSTRIAVGFTAKGDAKAQVGVAHERLADAESAARMKTYWRERLTELKRLLES